MVHLPETHKLLYAIEMASVAHQLQRRKGCLNIPYINHPIKVSLLLSECGFHDINILQAAILHDVIEDTDLSYSDLEKSFGKKVADIVLEVTDDMSLPSRKRKELQVIHASELSYEAGCLKIADKTCNIRDILTYPISWNNQRKRTYITWASDVVENINDKHPCLLEHFNNAVKWAYKVLD